jgi:hypothetical protein
MGQKGAKPKGGAWASLATLAACLCAASGPATLQSTAHAQSIFSGGSAAAANCAPIPQQTAPGRPAFSVETLTTGQLEDRVSRCNAAISRARNPQLQPTYFNAGQAKRALAERYMDRSDFNGARALLGGAGQNGAINHLSIAYNMNSADQRAKIELARSHRLAAQVYRYASQDSEMRASLDDAARILGQRQPYDDAETNFERAQIALTRDPVKGREEAFGYLQSGGAAPGSYLYERGPAALAEIAYALGREIMAQETQTPESTQLAINRLLQADTALSALLVTKPTADTHRKRNDVLEMLGELELRKAGALETGRAAEYDCAARVGEGGARLSAEQRGSLTSALRHFESVLASQPASQKANWGAGCAAMSLGEPGSLMSAQRYLGRAVQGDATEMRYHLAYARVLGLNDDRNGADEQFGRALRMLQSDAVSERSKIEVERILVVQIGKAALNDDFDRGRADNAAWSRALAGLNDAIRRNGNAQDKALAPAYLLRGKMRFFDNEMANARSDLIQAQRLTTSATVEDARAQAEAFHFLSKVEARLGAASTKETRRNHGLQSADYAKKAVQRNDREPAYRIQACLVRIQFRLTDGDSGAFCNADAARDGDRYPEFLVYEGMFHLAESFRLRGGNQARAWDNAYETFGRGIQAASSTPGVSDVVRERLIFGQASSLVCIGLEQFGRRTLDTRDGGPWSYFNAYGLGDCAPR